MPNNITIEKHGAIKYLVRCGQRMGGGYHNYFTKDGCIYGELGSTTELVVDKNGKVNKDGGSDGNTKREGLEDRQFLEDVNNLFPIKDLEVNNDPKSVCCDSTVTAVATPEGGDFYRCDKCDKTCLITSKNLT